MIFSQDRMELRKVYAAAWRKHEAGCALEPLEQNIAGVLEWHPEYHALLLDERSLAADFDAESGKTNPFLHLGLHIAIQEQLATDRPAGIRDLYRMLLFGIGDRHALEHAIMECLGECLWRAQRDGRAPDEQHYLACVRSLNRKSPER